MADTRFNHGGPAFPSVYPESENTTRGLSRLEYFAAHAPAIVLTHDRVLEEDMLKLARVAAGWAFIYAAAMLEEADKWR